MGIWLYLSMYAICKYTCGIVEMVQWVTVPATLTTWIERASSFKLSFDLHVDLSMYAVYVCAHAYAHTPPRGYRIKGQYVQKSFQLPHRFQGLISGSETWQKVFLFFAPSPGPTLAYICRCCEILPALLPLPANLGLVAGSASPICPL